MRLFWLGLLRAHAVAWATVLRLPVSSRLSLGPRDPAVGLELWDRSAIETLWHGEGIRLVREK
jgi:hypothetical protein